MRLNKETMAAMDHNFLAAMDALISNSVLGEFFESYRLGLYSGGIPNEHWNVAFVKRAAKKPREVMKNWEQYFVPRQFPYRVYFPPGTEEAFLPLLRERGYTASEPLPVMTLERFPEKIDERTDLTIRKVATPEELRDFQEAGEKGFSLPAGTGSFVITEQTFLLPELEMFIGYTDGKPACTSMLYPTGPVAGIYWVSVLPECRNRGFGAAITLAAVMAGKDRGCKFTVLQASPMGKPVYGRIGFDLPYNYSVYRSPT